jgi:hypothetical protein
VGNCMRERPRGKCPTSRLCRCWERCRGARTLSALDFFPGSPPLGKLHVPPLVVDVSKVVAIARGHRNPGSRPDRQPSIAGQKTSPAGAPPTLRATDRAVGRSAYAPSSGGTYALAFFPSTPWTDANGSFPSVDRRLGISHLIWHRCLSVHLIDRRLAREQVERRR